MIVLTLGHKKCDIDIFFKHWQHLTEIEVITFHSEVSKSYQGQLNILLCIHI